MLIFYKQYVKIINKIINLSTKNIKCLHLYVNKVMHILVNNYKITLFCLFFLCLQIFHKNLFIFFGTRTAN